MRFCGRLRPADDHAHVHLCERQVRLRRPRHLCLRRPDHRDNAPPSAIPARHGSSAAAVPAGHGSQAAAASSATLCASPIAATLLAAAARAAKPPTAPVAAASAAAVVARPAASAQSAGASTLFAVTARAAAPQAWRPHRRPALALCSRWRGRLPRRGRRNLRDAPPRRPGGERPVRGMRFPPRARRPQGARHLCDGRLLQAAHRGDQQVGARRVHAQHAAHAARVRH
mmetsp:Transcript_43830/g.141372  ORF Transcript_43830/g.141372 Transcript_43830/m.141372 type:complete len:228 (-) Transcript_43830:764-1447(-)